MEELNKKIKELEDRISQLETRRILQQDIMPQVVKSRHLDQVEMGLYLLDVNGVKRIGIGSLASYFYESSPGEIVTNSLFVTEGDLISVGGSTLALRIYRNDGQLVFGDGAGGYDVNLYRSSANTLATDDDLKFTATAKGPLLVDRTTATVYRLKVTSGVLDIEAV